MLWRYIQYKRKSGRKLKQKRCYIQEGFEIYIYKGEKRGFIKKNNKKIYNHQTLIKNVERLIVAGISESISC